MLPQLRSRFDQLEQRRAKFLQELAERPSEQLRYSPSAESWSLLQIAEHLKLVEEGLVVRWLVEQPGERLRRRLHHRIVYAGVMTLVFRLGMRVRMPGPGVAPDAPPSLAEVARRWTELRARLANELNALSESSAEGRFVRHPVLGPLDASGALRFLRVHFDHHMRQVQRVVCHSGFPRPASGTSSASARIGGGAA